MAPQAFVSNQVEMHPMIHYNSGRCVFMLPFSAGAHTLLLLIGGGRQPI
jgi:hypothetical protein